jgi:hypothetical protein
MKTRTHGKSTHVRDDHRHDILDRPACEGHTRGAQHVRMHAQAHVVFNVLSPERSASPQRLARHVPDRLRALLVLPGKRRVHLGCLAFGAPPAAMEEFIDVCRARMERVGVPPVVADPILDRVRERAAGLTRAPAHGTGEALRERAKALVRRYGGNPR